MKLVEKGSIKTVAVLLFDHVQIIDYAGPWEVFGEAGFKVFTVAEKAAPITSVFSQKLTPDYTFENSPRADILLVPGGGVGDASNNPRLIRWIQENAKTSDYVMSVCTGAFLLAKAGLLDGLTATTVRGGIDRLATVAPKTKVVYDQRYVDNGKIITTAGLSSGIDGAFHLLAKTLGEGQAESTALGMEYKWDPDSKYARAALPDRYLPDIDVFQGKVLVNHGDMDHWELRGIVWEPDSLAAIMELMGKQVESTAHTRSGAKLAPRTTANELRWTLTDETGGNWSGSATAEPAPDEKGQFIVTVKLNRKSGPTTAPGAK
jgi:putative intracellular protease/amidase